MIQCFLGLSLLDEDVSDFFTVMTMEECIREGQQLLRKDPDANLEVVGSEDMAEQIYKGTNRTQRNSHILCAGLRSKGLQIADSPKPMNIRSQLCYVGYNQTLADNSEIKRELNERNEKTERLIKSIFIGSCPFDEKSERLVSLKVVESPDQCNIHDLSLKISMGSQGMEILGKSKPAIYVAIVLATFGFFGNLLSCSVYLSPGYHHKQIVYFMAKVLCEMLALICTVIYVSLLLSPNDIMTGYVYPILYQFAMFARNWITVVIGVEKCVAVWAPFMARAYFGRGLSIKVSLAIITIAVLFTSADFLTKYFASDLAKFINIDYLFIGGEVKLAILCAIFCTLLPWTIVLLCSVVTVLGIRSSRKKRAELTNRAHQSGENQQQNDNNDLILPVLLSMFSFIVFSIPVVMHAVLTALTSTLETLFLSLGIIENLKLVVIFFNIIGFSMDFYLLFAAQTEFRAKLKENFISTTNIGTHSDPLDN